MYKTLDNILTQLEDNKALDIISIDLKGKSDIADFLVIATGTSNRTCRFFIREFNQRT